jgi:hypothetical protein
MLTFLMLLTKCFSSLLRADQRWRSEQETAYSLLHAVVSDGEEDWEDAAAETSSGERAEAPLSVLL